MEWYFDSGATSQMAKSNEGFVEEHEMPHPVGTANNGSMVSVARGVVRLELTEGPIEVYVVLRIPELTINLFSDAVRCVSQTASLLLPEHI